MQDAKISDCFERLHNISESTFKEKCIYHSECYKDVTNVTLLRRLSNKKKENDQSGSENRQEEDRDKEMEVESETKEVQRTTRSSKIISYNKELCIICQNRGGKLRKVEFLQTGKNMHEVAKMITNKDFFLRLNTIPNAEDAVANDVVYHLRCWVDVQHQIYTMIGIKINKKFACSKSMHTKVHSGLY